jgi:iron complex transport system substrate-binding protein
VPSCRPSLFAIALLGAAACTQAPRAPAVVHVTDDWGRGLDVAPATRIVSLAPATTELVFALGLGDRLVGRTSWCDYPEAVAAVADVGAGLGPNVEAIAALRPDLVLLYASEANREALRQLEALGIGVAALRVDRAADMRRAARTIAALGGRAAAGDSLVATFDTALAAAAAAAGTGGRRPRVYVDVQSAPPLTVGAGSYLSEILDAAGAANVFGEVPTPSAPVSLEAIAVRDPEVVLVLRSDTTRGHDLDRRAGWRALRAVREGRVLVVPGALYDRPSPRMPGAVRDLASRLAAFRAP